MAEQAINLSVSVDSFDIIDLKKAAFRIKHAGQGTYFSINEHARFLKTFAVNKGLTQSRICYHENNNSLMQKMLVFHSCHHVIGKHYHSAKDEFITLLSGSMKIVFFDADGIDIQDECILDSSTGPKTCFIPKNHIHDVHVIEDVVFIEDTTGPFIKTSTLRID